MPGQTGLDGSDGTGVAGKSRCVDGKPGTAVLQPAAAQQQRMILRLSAERDLQLRLRLAAWRAGYRAGLAAAGDRYGVGYAQCTADVKRAQHALYDHLITAGRIEHARWGAAGRGHYADARPGDYPGQEDTA